MRQRNRARSEARDKASQDRRLAEEPVKILRESLANYLVPGPDGRPLGDPTLEIAIGTRTRTIVAVRIRYGKAEQAA